MHDFVSLDYDFHLEGCMGIWAAPLWMTPDTWQWDAGSGEIDSSEFCARDAFHMNFAGGGHQVEAGGVSLDQADGHVTVRKDAAGMVTVAACALGGEAAHGGQCAPPDYGGDCDQCEWGENNTFACWCNAGSGNIYGSGGCAEGTDCQWTLVSDVWNGVSGDAGYQGCMTEVPSIGLAAGTPNLASACKLSIENVTVLGGGDGGSLQWGAGSPDYCGVFTPSPAASGDGGGGADTRLEEGKVFGRSRPL